METDAFMLDGFIRNDKVLLVIRERISRVASTGKKWICQANIHVPIRNVHHFLLSLFVFIITINSEML